MHIFTHLYMIYIYILMYMHEYMHLHKYMYICTYTYIHIIYMHVTMFVLYMYMYLYFRMFICVQCRRIDGNVPWSERQGLMDSFNTASIDHAFVSCTCMLRYVLKTHVCCGMCWRVLHASILYAAVCVEESVARFNTGPINYVAGLKRATLLPDTLCFYKSHVCVAVRVAVCCNMALWTAVCCNTAL